MQNTDITFDARGSRVEEGYLPQRDSAAELNEYNRQTDEETHTCSYVYESGEECARPEKLMMAGRLWSS